MPTADAFAKQVEGNVFVGTTSSGQVWRMEFKSDGYVYWNNGAPQVESGKWRIEDQKICIDVRRNPTCNEFRVSGKSFFYKRVSNGEVVELKR